MPNRVVCASSDFSVWGAVKPSEKCFLLCGVYVYGEPKKLNKIEKSAVYLNEEQLDGF